MGKWDLSDEQIGKLSKNLLAVRGGRGVTVDELEVVCDWAICAMLERAVLEDVLSGRLGIEVIDGDVVII